MAETGLPENGDGNGARNDEQKQRVLPGWGLTVFSLLVALDAVFTIWVEATTHITASNLTNPMPGAWHLAGLIAVPALLLLTPLLLRGHGKPSPLRLACLCLGNGYLIAVGLLYTLLYLPLILVAFPLLVVSGIGLMILAPSLTLIAALWQCVALRHCAGGSPRKIAVLRWCLGGFAVAAAVYLGWEGWYALSKRAAEQVFSENPEVREAGMQTLRRWGNDEVLLALRPWSDGGSLLQRPPRLDYGEYRLLFYRLTGRDFRTIERPRFGRIPQNLDDEEDALIFPSSSPELLLRASSLDVRVDSSPDDLTGSGTAYAEWTLEFFNRHPREREAVCQVVLPPGGVASRLTLWIEGEEREAAFGRRAVVTEAYEKIVRRRLDPALLTEAGPDRVRLQCFPVPAHATMQVKVGFTLPLIPDGDEFALLLPYIAERNFAFAPDRRTAVTVYSGAPPVGPGLSADLPPLSGDAVHVLRGAVAPADLPLLRVSVPAPQPGRFVYGADLAGVFATSALTEEPALKERLVAVVLDTSARSAKTFALDWASVLERLPDSVRVALFAGPLALPAMEREEAARRWPEALRDLPFVGGDEQTGNLLKALDLCAPEENAAILWLHGPLPMRMPDVAKLKSGLRQGTEGRTPPVFASLQMAPGVNRTEEGLSASGMLRLPSFYDRSPEERLSRVFADLLYPSLSRRELLFERVPPPNDTALPGSSEIAQLAFARELDRKLRVAEGAALPEETETALRMRLVTPLTGAVVLESAEQYAENDLDPAADRDSVPTIPEPEEWALLAVVALFLPVAYRIRRRRATRSI